MENIIKTYSFVIMEREASPAKKFLADNIGRLPVVNINRPRDFRMRKNGKGYILRTLKFDTPNKETAKKICDHLGLEFSQQITMYII